MRGNIQPPYSIEAEQAVLGSLMLNNDLWDDLGRQVGKDDFYRQDHRLIFGAIVDLFSRRYPVDFITLSEFCREKGILEDCGGVAYLGTLASDLGSTANFRAYAQVVRDKATLREVAAAASSILEKAYSPDGDSTELVLDTSEQKIFEIRRKRAQGRENCMQVADLVPEFQANLEKLVAHKGAVPGLKTGFRKLDQMTHGLHPGDLIIVAGRPGMGKTSFAMNIAEHAAFVQKVPTVFFSMEMASQQLFVRLVSSAGRIDQGALRSGIMQDEDWDRLVSLMPLLQEAPLFIDETPALTPLDLRSRVRAIARRQNLGLVVIDYIQLMQIPNSRENRTNEVAEISRGLKALAKEMRVPVIALSQLSRAVASRDSKRPVMTDLRDSGGIEQDADLILFVHREAYYRDGRVENAGQSTEKLDQSEIIVAKHRNGSTGTVPVNFLDRFTRFEDFVEFEPTEM